MKVKKILIALIIFLSAASVVNAQAVASYGTTVYTFLTFTNATGNGTTFAIPQASIAYIAWCTSFGTAPASITINLQESNDNSAWATVDSSTSTAGECRSVFSANKFVRGNISAVSGGTTTTLSINIQRVSTSNSNINTNVAAIATKLLLGNGTAAAPSLTQNTGQNNGIYFGTNQILFSTAGTGRWQISAAGHFVATTDNIYDIGANGATRPRSIYAGSTVFSGGGFDAPAGGFFDFSGRIGLYSSANGLVQLKDNSATFGIEINTGTTAPTVSACGTGAVTAGSRNSAGQATATGATACTVTFGTPAFTNAPFCTVVDGTGARALFITAASTTAFTVNGLTAGDVFTWNCVGRI